MVKIKIALPLLVIIVCFLFSNTVKAGGCWGKGSKGLYNRYDQIFIGTVVSNMETFGHRHSNLAKFMDIELFKGKKSISINVTYPTSTSTSISTSIDLSKYEVGKRYLVYARHYKYMKIFDRYSADLCSEGNMIGRVKESELNFLRSKVKSNE